MRLCLGKIYYNPAFVPLILSPSQADWPGTVYDGYSGHLNIKFYYSGKIQKYCNFQLTYKNVSYRNINFLDMYNGEKYYAYYTRSEDAYVLGLTIVHGHEYAIGKFAYVDFFYGIGIRMRERNITTLTNDTYGGKIKTPVGDEHFRQIFPVIDMGIKIGFNLF